MRHVVWDWNGTLLDDQDLVIEALNAVLDDAGLPPISADDYRRLYTRPLRVFYERVFGRSIGAAQWERIDRIFHDAYQQALDRARLASDADVALDGVAAVGGSQSLLSMFPHEQLLPLIDRFGLATRFTVVDGLRGTGGGVKAPYLEHHLDRVRASLDGPHREVVMIGDALDDAGAARQAGIDCVLYDGGSHPRRELEAAGVPVTDSLAAAVRTAIGD